MRRSTGPSVRRRPSRRAVARDATSLPVRRQSVKHWTRIAKRPRVPEPPTVTPGRAGATGVGGVVGGAGVGVGGGGAAGLPTVIVRVARPAPPRKSLAETAAVYVPA